MKTFPYIIISIILLSIDFLVIAVDPNISVTVFTERYFNGLNETLYFSTCSSNLHTHATLGGKISSINSRGKCVNLYKSTNCQGEYILIKPGTPIHYDLSVWSGGFYKNVNSIGPCFPRCDPRAAELPTQVNSTHLVTLYVNSGYKGAHTTLNLEMEECHLIPLALKRRISSVQVHGNFCIELHQTWNCNPVSTSKFTQLRPNSPKHTDLVHWVGHDNKAFAVSLCGFDCKNGTQSRSNFSRNGKQKILGKNADAVTIFDDDEAFYKGHFKLLNFSSHHKCANLDRDWDGQLNTFDPNGHCLIIYDEFNCSSSNIGRNVTIPSNISATEVSTFLKVRNFDRVAQSLKLCEWDGQPEKFVGFETSAKSIFFVVLFSLVAISCVSVGLAFVVKKTFGNGFEIKFNMRSRGSGHSLIL